MISRISSEKQASKFRSQILSHKMTQKIMSPNEAVHKMTLYLILLLFANVYDVLVQAAKFPWSTDKSVDMH